MSFGLGGLARGGGGADSGARRVAAGIVLLVAAVELGLLLFGRYL
jgi:hypothetical protein